MKPWKPNIPVNNRNSRDEIKNIIIKSSIGDIASPRGTLPSTYSSILIIHMYVPISYGSNSFENSISLHSGLFSFTGTCKYSQKGGMLIRTPQNSNTYRSFWMWYVVNPMNVSVLLSRTSSQINLGYYFLLSCCPGMFLFIHCVWTKFSLVDVSTLRGRKRVTSKKGY